MQVWTTEDNRLEPRIANRAHRWFCRHHISPADGPRPGAPFGVNRLACAVGVANGGIVVLFEPPDRPLAEGEDVALYMDLWAAAYNDTPTVDGRIGELLTLTVFVLPAGADFAAAAGALGLDPSDRFTGFWKYAKAHGLAPLPVGNPMRQTV